jgi:hypothetical protein
MSSPDRATDLGMTLRLIITLVGLALFFGGLAILLLSPLKLLGFTVVAAGLVVSVTLGILTSADHLRARLASPVVWWHDPKTHQVASGRFAPGYGWDGPYGSEEDATRAPEIARARAAEWNAED